MFIEALNPYFSKSGNTFSLKYRKPSSMGKGCKIFAYYLSDCEKDRTACTLKAIISILTSGSKHKPEKRFQMYNCIDIKCPLN